MKFEEEIHKLSARIAVLEDQAGISPLAHELPIKEPQPDLGPVRELPAPIAVATRNPEGDPLVKTSGDGEDAGINPSGEPVSGGLYLTNLKDPNAYPPETPHEAVEAEKAAE